MKKLLFITLAVLSCITNIDALVVKNPVDYVNPLVGTASKSELSTGNTYPAKRFQNFISFR